MALSKIRTPIADFSVSQPFWVLGTWAKKDWQCTQIGHQTDKMNTEHFLWHINIWRHTGWEPLLLLSSDLPDSRRFFLRCVQHKLVYRWSWCSSCFLHCICCTTPDTLRWRWWAAWRSGADQLSSLRRHLWRKQKLKNDKALFYYRVCHGFRLTKWDDYFLVNFDHFWIERHFLRQLGQ